MPTNKPKQQQPQRDRDQDRDDAMLPEQPIRLVYGTEVKRGASGQEVFIATAFKDNEWPGEDVPLLVVQEGLPVPMPESFSRDQWGYEDETLRPAPSPSAATLSRAGSPARIREDDDTSEEGEEDNGSDVAPWLARVQGESLRNWQAKQIYVGLGFTRTLKRTAEYIADQELLLWHAHKLTFAKLDGLMKSAVKERNPAWFSRVRNLHKVLETWSARFGWRAAAMAYDQQIVEQVYRARVDKVIKMDLSHEKESVQMQIWAHNAMERAEEEKHPAPEGAIKQMALALQTQRVALLSGPFGLGAGGGKAGRGGIGDVSGLLGGLGTNPAGLLSQRTDASQGPATPSSQQDVTVTQVNNQTTNIQVNAMQPLTVDVLRSLQAQGMAQLSTYRQQRGLPAYGSSEDPWIEASTTPAPAGLPAPSEPPNSDPSPDEPDR